jgi:hypothetical protein
MLAIRLTKYPKCQLNKVILQAKPGSHKRKRFLTLEAPVIPCERLELYTFTT